MASWFDIFAAQLFALKCWYKNNRWMILSDIIWPYLIVGLLLGMGSMFGSLENYAQRMGVSRPILFLLSSTVVAMSSLMIAFSAAGFVRENRWLGTLPYILLTPAGIHTIVIFAGLPSAVISPVMTMTAIAPAAVYFEGVGGVLRIWAVLLIVLFGMLPLLGFSALAASVLLMVKEESNVFDMVAPLILLVSGVYYPLEVLPKILQLVGRVLPTTYVVEAARLLATYMEPEIRLLLAPIYMLTALALGYNLLASLVLGRAERAVKRKGVI